VTSALSWHAWLAVSASAAAVLGAALLVLMPRPVRLPLERRRPAGGTEGGTLTGATIVATSLIGRVLARRGWGRSLSTALERAGVAMAAVDVGLFLGVAVLVAASAGLLLRGWLGALLLSLLVPVLAKVWLAFKTRRRINAFAEQLDDSLQLMASSLRAGHSLLQALAAVAAEAEEPTSTELTRVINETRVGRELGSALDEAGERMKSQDFVWVTQAIAINREVGGNLADVLDGVSGTIRERNQIRRQVKALAAEGKLSAIVLMVLPFGVGGFLLMTTPSYVMKFTESLLGYGMLAVAFLLLVAGALWLRKSVQVTF
jgi:tight adherence protein B